MPERRCPGRGALGQRDERLFHALVAIESVPAALLESVGLVALGKYGVQDQRHARPHEILIAGEGYPFRDRELEGRTFKFGGFDVCASRFGRLKNSHDVQEPARPGRSPRGAPPVLGDCGVEAAGSHGAKVWVRAQSRTAAQHRPRTLHSRLLAPRARSDLGTAKGFFRTRAYRGRLVEAAPFELGGERFPIRAFRP